MPKDPQLIIIKDTREQKPLNFSRFKNVQYEQQACLPVGDYACVMDSGISSTYFERKSKADLWGTMASKEYERFKREYNKAIELGIKLVLIVECDIDEIAKGYSYVGRGGLPQVSKFAGSSMCKKLETLRLKHGLEVVYKRNRSAMKRYMYERWLAEARLQKG